jgi:hypothetical protein
MLVVDGKRGSRRETEARFAALSQKRAESQKCLDSTTGRNPRQRWRQHSAGYNPLRVSVERIGVRRQLGAP